MEKGYGPVRYKFPHDLRLAQACARRTGAQNRKSAARIESARQTDLKMRVLRVSRTQESP